MTDREELEGMLLRAGIVVRKTDSTVAIHADDNDSHRGAQGYPGFFCEFTFTPEGRLSQVASWE